jgi:hypothetical protein
VARWWAEVAADVTKITRSWSSGRGAAAVVRLARQTGENTARVGPLNNQGLYDGAARRGYALDNVLASLPLG